MTQEHETNTGAAQGGIKHKLTQPDFVETVIDLQGGSVASLATRWLADVAMAVGEYGTERSAKDGKGTFRLTLEILPAKGSSGQMLSVRHDLSISHPTANGRLAENSADEQVMFVNKIGALSPTPDSQGAFNFDTDGGES